MFELSAPLPQYVAGYFFFCDSIRARVREANKDKKMTELSGIMAKEWKALGDEEKQVRDQDVMCVCVCMKSVSYTHLTLPTKA